MRGTRKLLVANRSEIACRVFQTAREMGFRAVGLLAPGDEEARHVSFADELIRVPSYLDGAAIVAAAKEAGVSLLHPGYGFLSERSSFASQVEKAGISFLGPRAETIEAMGGKIPSKELAERNGVPVLPWAKVEKGGDLRKAADRVGYPLLLKASSGGGGKGMRKVAKAADLEAALESAQAEALSAFGEGTVFLERMLESARHIEVQVFGDGSGGGVHLHERDCSLQRRHQKIWEEAPAAKLSEGTRAKLHEAALRLVRATKYRSAGTCEFLVDGAGDPYFLEMNTRLQVEHPVTEFVTGLDLVRAQIELALDPQRSPLTETPPVRGHSIEVRFYAEDPAAGYVPTPGRVARLRFPMGPGIRVDSGIEEGQTISSGFDSMLAKLIVHAPDRAHAIARLRLALEETVLLGLGTNQSFLRALCDHPRVQAGDPDIAFLERELSSFRSDPGTDEMALFRAARGGIAPDASSAGNAREFPSPWRAG